MSKCLNEKCSKDANHRGLCAGCYAFILRSIKRGEISDADAVKAGQILKCKKRGRKPKAEHAWMIQNIQKNDSSETPNQGSS